MVRCCRNRPHVIRRALVTLTENRLADELIAGRPPSLARRGSSVDRKERAC